VGQLVGIGLLEEPLGLVHGVGGPSAEEVGRQRHEPRCRQPVAHGPEERLQAPPRVQDEDPGTVLVVGKGQVARAGVSLIHRGAG
jgi:hypothetical protein